MGSANLWFVELKFDGSLQGKKPPNRRFFGISSAKRNKFLAFLWVLAVFSACFGGNRTRSPGDPRLTAAIEKPLVMVSILPQSWFAERVAGGRARVAVLAGPGQNPHNYEPSPRQMSDLAEAKVWILSGTEFEISLRPKIEGLFPGLWILDGTEGVRFRRLEEGEGEDHGEDPGEAGSGDSIPSGMDRHTWLGEEPAKIMAAHIRDALSAIDGEGAPQYQANYAALIQEITGEFDALRGELAPLRGAAVFVYHPAFGYFLDEFGIVQRAVETGGKEPGPRDLARLIGDARREQAAAIFVQAQFPAEAARTVAAAIGAELLPLDPLAADWLSNIRLMGSALKRAARMPGRGGGGE
jgi:zinc transport system substrate-binding protein